MNIVEEKLKTKNTTLRDFNENVKTSLQNLHDSSGPSVSQTEPVERLLSDSTQTLKGRIQALSDQVRVSLESKTSTTASGHTSRTNVETPALNAANAQETRAGAPNRSDRRHVQTLSSGH